MFNYMIADVKVRLRLRQKPVLTDENVEVNEQFVYDLLESVLEPDEQILEYKCTLVPEELFKEGVK